MKVQRVDKTWYVMSNSNVVMFTGSWAEVMSQVKEYLAKQ